MQLGDPSLHFWLTRSVGRVMGVNFTVEMANQRLTPEDYAGGIIGDLTSRRGMVQGQDTRGNAIVIDAMVPLANMFGYINTLRSMSSGRAQFTMQFDHYDPVPSNISEEIQAKYA